MAREDYEVVIGLEVHAELSTKTKIFCSCPTSFGAAPNTHVCPICTAMPGTLPVLNEKVVEYAVRAGLATECTISQDSKNDRKNYFYPDLPKAYQISQYDKPLCEHGKIEIEPRAGRKTIGITRIHIEEDAGKLNHDEFGRGSLVDLNRAGVPLIEIVSEPDLRSSEEVDLYLKKLKSILEYIEVSDCKMQEGSLRADVNVSIRKKESDPFGTKAEIKNIGSISNVKLSIDKEIERQAKLYDNGETFLPQTRRFDSKLNDTVLMRVKETGNDYRYFPEPDIPYVYITEEQIDEVRKTIPMLPDARRKKYIELGISEVNAKKLVGHRILSDYLNELFEEKIDFKTAANLLLGDISAYLNKNETEITKTKLTKEKFMELTNNISDGTLTSKNLKEILDMVMESDKSIAEIVKEAGIQNITDNSAITDMIKKIINENPESVADYKAGKDRAIKYLMGQVMKESKGSINPSMAMDILKEELK